MNEDFETRDLMEDDYYKGFLELLDQLTTTGSIPKDSFLTQFEKIKQNENHIIRVIIDKQSQKVVAAGTLLIEPKFIHKCSSVGHIEDIVVDQEMRGKRLGQKIVQDLTDLSQSRGCYKTILNCNASNTGFYEKCGYTQKEVEMVLYHKK